MSGSRGKLEEGVPSRWPSWTTRMDTSTARKGLSPLLNTTLDPIEERNKEAEVAYMKSKTKVTRITELQNDFYDKHTFDENDPKFTEMKSLGDIKDLQVHTKILLDEVNRLNLELKEATKGCYEIMTEIEESTNDYLYTSANLEFNKYNKTDIIKGVKEAFLKIKEIMTSNPQSVIRTIKSALFKAIKPIYDCTSLIDGLSKIEHANGKIEEAANALSTPTGNVDKTLIKCLRKMFKDTPDNVKATLPSATRLFLEELDENKTTTTFKETAKQLREITKKHVEEEKKRDREASDQTEAIEGQGEQNKMVAFKANQQKGIAERTKDIICNNMKNDGRCQFGDKCMYKHNAGDRSPSTGRHNMYSNRDHNNVQDSRDYQRQRSRSRDRQRDRDRDTRDRDRDRDRDRNRDRDRSRSRDRGRERDRDRDRGRTRERSSSSDTVKKTPDNTRKGISPGGGGGGGGGARGQSSSSKA